MTGSVIAEVIIVFSCVKFWVCGIRLGLAKINQLYRGDPNFRNYVTRYLAQFDELIESARRSGQEGVLGASFMTSDAGKVYMILQSALAREFGGAASGTE